MLRRTAQVVRKAYAEVDEDLQEAIDNGENPIIDIAVSFDGTWQKRGFTSRYGVGVCIDVLTGLVVDFHVRSKYCHQCKLNEKKMSTAEFQAWKDQRDHDCCINHTTSSKSMEQEAAKVMWNRSVERFGFRYIEMLSDGDSSAYNAVCGEKPYGDKKIDKLECVNHAHKRMGTALRKLTKEERLGGRGVGRLTDAKCESLQNFYRGAIIDNCPNVEAMRNAVWAGLWHSMSTEEEPQHRQCPVGENSWCFYQQALAKGEHPPSHADHPCHTFLTRSVAHKLIPVYRRMSDEALLRRMAHGGTQNNNECLNATIWARCPKTAFMGLRRVKGSVARAVCAFNEGATELITIMNMLYVDITHITLQKLEQKDSRRISKADVQSSAEARQRRKNYTGQHRALVRAQEAQDGNVYNAGGH